jgi:hypothetical protein
MLLAELVEVLIRKKAHSLFFRSSSGRRLGRRCTSCTLGAVQYAAQEYLLYSGSKLHILVKKMIKYATNSFTAIHMSHK